MLSFFIKIVDVLNENNIPYLRSGSIASIFNIIDHASGYKAFFGDLEE